MARAHDLIANGCEISVFGSGLLPDMWDARSKTEQDKYTKMWAHDEYRVVSPGADCVNDFLNVVRPTGKIIDFGCGTGRAAKLMADCGLDVLLVDFTDNSRDKEAQLLPFIKKDLIKKMDIHGDYGFCTDVLEHINPFEVDDVINNIMACCPTIVRAVVHITLSREYNTSWNSPFRDLNNILF